MHTRDGVMRPLAAVCNKRGNCSQPPRNDDNFNVENFGGNALDHLGDSARDLTRVGARNGYVESQLAVVVTVILRSSVGENF